MKKAIEANDLHLIADEITSNADMLDLVDPESAELEIDIYTSRIRQLADDLRGIAEVSHPV